MDSNKRSIEMKLLEDDFSTLKVIFFLKQGNVTTDFPFTLFLWKKGKVRMLIPSSAWRRENETENYPVSIRKLETLEKIDKGLYILKLRKDGTEFLEIVWTSEGRIEKKKIKILDNNKKK